MGEGGKYHFQVRHFDIGGGVRGSKRLSSYGVYDSALEMLRSKIPNGLRQNEFRLARRQGGVSRFIPSSPARPVQGRRRLKSKRVGEKLYVALGPFDK